MTVVDASDFFHPYFDLFILKAYVVLKIIKFDSTQIDPHVADSIVSNGFDDGDDVMDKQGTTRSGYINVKPGEVLHDMAVSIHSE